MDKDQAAASERDAQTKYWKEHTGQASMESMLLDTQACSIDKLERPEIMSLLGPLDGLRVVELGAGIGRFTAELAKTAKKVTAYDFMETLTAENVEKNGHLPNVDIACQDITKAEMKPNSCDVVFSNWLLMYLSDEEITVLMKKCLKWLSVDGTIFFRESCFRQSGDVERSSNPSHYRDPNEYFQILDRAVCLGDNGQKYKFELINARCVESYVKLKKNQNQIAWKWKKVEKSESDVDDFRHFLDGSQYKMQGILRYERMFGKGFISTGGIETTREVTSKIQLKKGAKILDVGCGIGGGDFFLAEEYGASVLGVDLSVNMFLVALQRSMETTADVTFEVSDITKREFPKECFDVIYSRDTILHIDDKPKLFRRLYSFLKPGGSILITDYCRSSANPSKSFADYIKQRGYDLHSVEKYGKMLEDAGFVDVTAQDFTFKFEECLRAELANMQTNRDAFLLDFSEADYTALLTGWKEKLLRVDGGEQKWGLFIGYKPE